MESEAGFPQVVRQRLRPCTAGSPLKTKYGLHTLVWSRLRPPFGTRVGGSGQDPMTSRRPARGGDYGRARAGANRDPGHGTRRISEARCRIRRFGDGGGARARAEPGVLGRRKRMGNAARERQNPDPNLPVLRSRWIDAREGRGGEHRFFGIGVSKPTDAWNRSAPRSRTRKRPDGSSLPVGEALEGPSGLTGCSEMPSLPGATTETERGVCERESRLGGPRSASASRVDTT